MSLSYREFNVPCDEELLEFLGVSPQPGDETGVSVLRFEASAGACLVAVTPDAGGRARRR